MISESRSPEKKVYEKTAFNAAARNDICDRSIRLGRHVTGDDHIREEITSESPPSSRSPGSAASHAQTPPQFRLDLKVLTCKPYPRVETPSLRSRSRACNASGERGYRCTTCRNSATPSSCLPSSIKANPFFNCAEAALFPLGKFCST
jgi:hypothetical protein